MKRQYCLVVLLLVSLCGWAQNDSLQNKINIGMNLLTHGETCGGGLPRAKDKVVDDNYNFLLGRLRLSVGYERKGLEAKAVIQNSAVWGSKGNTTLNLYEGWAKMTSKQGLFVQLGRVALSYDDERIIGPNDFAMASRSHDILRAGYEGKGHKAHAILAFNQNASNLYVNDYYVDGGQSYKNMQTVWYHYDFNKIPLGVSLLFINVGLQAGEEPVGPKSGTAYNVYMDNPARTVYQQMYGCYVKYNPRPFTVEGSYYRQRGKEIIQSTHPGKIDAWMLSVKATVRPCDLYGIETGYDFLSGDDYVPVTYGGMFGMVRHEVNKGFNPLYGSRTKFYGIMDYFYKDAYINDFTPGLQNAFLGGYVKPTVKLKCRAIYHYMATATKLDGLDKTLGHAIDLQGSYTFSKDISLTAGYTYMIGTETMDRLKKGEGSKNAHWGWFSLVISPSLFTAKF